jgi:hypothetical protein
MFRSLFQDYLQGSSFALSAYHASAARFVICLYWYVVVCPLFVFVSSVPACVLSGRKTIKDKVVCAPDDGWKYHPKHVEQFPDINKLCNDASCWINFRCTYP